MIIRGVFSMSIINRLKSLFTGENDKEETDISNDVSNTSDDVQVTSFCVVPVTVVLNVNVFVTWIVVLPIAVIFIVYGLLTDGSTEGSTDGFVGSVGVLVGPQPARIPKDKTRANNFENNFISFPPIYKQELHRYMLN